MEEMSTQTKEEAEARDNTAVRLAKVERMSTSAYDPEIEARRANLPPHLQ